MRDVSRTYIIFLFCTLRGANLAIPLRLSCNYCNLSELMYSFRTVVGASFMAPVVAIVNVVEVPIPKDGRDKSGPYDEQYVEWISKLCSNVSKSSSADSDRALFLMVKDQ